MYRLHSDNGSERARVVKVYHGSRAKEVRCLFWKCCLYFLTFSWSEHRKPQGSVRESSKENILLANLEGLPLTLFDLGIPPLSPYSLLNCEVPFLVFNGGSWNYIWIFFLNTSSIAQKSVGFEGSLEKSISKALGIDLRVFGRYDVFLGNYGL